VLNATGKHGPNLGNSIGCLGMMFSVFESLAYNVRGEDDMLNVIGAGALAGGVFKSQAVSVPCQPVS
jgi:import inner membrane translocase subunit TIM23